MRRLPLLLALLAPVASHAFTVPQSGAYVDIGAGGLLDTASPVGIGPGWRAAAGVWWGKFDKDYSLGKYKSLGVSLEQAWLFRAGSGSAGGLLSAPMVEFRAGQTVVVVDAHWFAAAGPDITDSVGVGGLVGGGVKYRINPTVGISARLGAGAAWHPDEPVRARVLLQIAFSWSAPFGGRG